MSEKLAWINSTLTRNFGLLTHHLLMRCYGLAREALWVIPELALRGGRGLEPAGLSMVWAEIAANQAANTTLLYLGSNCYLERLDQFDETHAIISFKDNRQFLSRPAIAMVNERNASPNSL